MPDQVTSFSQGIDPSAVIHPTAVVAEGARIGPGCRIGPWCVISSDAVLEEGVTLTSHVVIDGQVHLGAGVQVMSFASIGLPPQDLKYRGEPTRVEIGPRTIIREHATIHRGSVGGHGVTRVGADCLIMCVAHIGHDCVLDHHVILANNVMLGGHVQIGDTVFVGGGAAIHQFVRIGRQVVVGGMSGVEGDVIPFGAVMGNRARLTGLNLIGLKRRGFPRSQINTLRAAYRALFRSPGVFDDRVAGVEAQHGADPVVQEILAFVRADSHRGLCRAGREVVEDEDTAEAS
ncbi:acyl-ACP--UDP-N-acetylglucosamine O-acyltransferase [Roseomonas marmotae]|uniref:Acyl-[acyl-carrier-protein]--UDP-N-acetylglucosamine O-acyltransferase n=1 Tax=Roseomonas marmotae TaxID=2768161 RepID=A0ABS3KD50_9PROT|nr:acyl-ACP--UDP-N-acetylglucosamine O-acyltransferase [Roseomonas marmotae]MBO1074286.1 acyl-ACP--UDP-N-acetylglucosamine O-acyltransferase [Roseomonas marmotae]QTI78040.1 acyl-ACP--UDP-N-acetylglucosamine O-acyltransferase [Roseomonas marmotae]